VNAEGLMHGDELIECVCNNTHQMTNNGEEIPMLDCDRCHRYYVFCIVDLISFEFTALLLFQLYFYKFNILTIFISSLFHLSILCFGRIFSADF
jgi:hypothetical protein